MTMIYRCFNRNIRYVTRIAALVLIIAMTLAFTAACNDLPIMNNNPTAKPAATSTPGRQEPSEGGNPPVDGMELTTPLAGMPAVPIVLSPVASGRLTESNERAVIDYSNTADGYVMIKWLAGEAVDKGLRVQIVGPTGAIYVYTLNTNGGFEVYPLSDGNGAYTIMVATLLGDGKGAVALSLTIDVALTDEFAPFLRPNQFVNFSETDKVVRKAAELVTAESDFIEKIAAIYSFVIENITYDVDLANDIIAGKYPNYLPVIDTVYEKGKGICFDFAAVMAAMLRSQGIPTKLVTGMVNIDLNHAWLSVYSEEEGWIDAIIFFDGSNWEMVDPTFASAGDSKALRDFIGDGSNYIEMKLY